jgi:Protein of unknown function (DUF2934)
MSKRTTSKPADSQTPAPRRKTPAAAPSVSPKPAARARRTVAAPTGVSEAQDNSSRSSNGLSYDAIATRAYFIALEHGFQSDPVADWLTAERQLREASARS